MQQQIKWPAEGNARVPYRMFSDPEIYRAELSRIFLGPTWQYLALAGELPAERALLVHSLSHVRALQGDYRSARALMEESLRGLRALGDRPDFRRVKCNRAGTARNPR